MMVQDVNKMKYDKDVIVTSLFEKISEDVVRLQKSIATT